ncbi:hypothetical protein ACTNCI_00090 [Mitsuokella jalaludinii]|uniref:hypothetical protein n=1 Tax=Mitsuokella jalaludinii TaxID=187979 RepID=UPI003F8C927A
MKRYENTEKSVHEAAAILKTLAGTKYHEYFVAAAPVEHGERYAKHFIVDTNASPSAVFAMVAEAIIREAEIMGDEPEEVLRHVASRVKHRAKEVKQDER